MADRVFGIVAAMALAVASVMWLANFVSLGALRA
jgi:hypothetical protein